MNHLLNITKKELRELLTPGALLSIVVIMMLLICVGSAIGGEAEESSSAPEIGIVYNADGGTADYGFDDPADVKQLVLDSYRTLYGASEADAQASISYLDCVDDTAIMSAIKDRGLAYVLTIPDTAVDDIRSIIDNTSPHRMVVGTYFVYENSGLFGSASSTAGTSLVAQMNTVLSEKLTVLATDSTVAEYISFPVSWGATNNHTDVNGTIYDDVTPYALSESMMGQSLMVPIVIMIVILMVGSVVISSMGSEKENKTLETLLTLPIKRSTIISGKLLAATVVGAVYGVAYMIGMMFYTSGITMGGTSVDLAKYGLSMDPLDWVLVGIILFLSIFSALGICMILGAFTKNYKMAQQMTAPISFLALIPMFVFMFMSWASLPGIGKALMFAIPFSHPMMALTNLMFGDITLVMAGIAYLAVFDATMIFITVKIYNSDILITGLDQTKFMKTLKKMLKIKEGEHGEN